MITVLYGVGIQEAAASGDLERMKSVARQAEEYLRESGDVPAALEALKIEIAKLEKKHR
jgi:HPt (histidine-containing phosphotransfer) domain-containing protein